MTTRYKKVSEVEIQRQIKEDPDDFELTPDAAGKGKPFREALPDLAASIDHEIARRGRPPKDVTKKPVTVRLNPETIEKFKATGKGWQTRMSDVLDAAKV